MWAKCFINNSQVNGKEIKSFTFPLHIMFFYMFVEVCDRKKRTMKYNNYVQFLKQFVKRVPKNVLLYRNNIKYFKIYKYDNNIKVPPIS